jgi:hypothetical protein
VSGALPLQVFRGHAILPFPAQELHFAEPWQRSDRFAVCSEVAQHGASKLQAAILDHADHDRPWN